VPVCVTALTNGTAGCRNFDSDKRNLIYGDHYLADVKPSSISRVQRANIFVQCNKMCNATPCAFLEACVVGKLFQLIHAIGSSRNWAGCIVVCTLTIRGVSDPYEMTGNLS